MNRYFLVAKCHGPPSDITRANPLEYSRSTPFGEAVGQFVACCLVKVLVKTIDSVAAAHAHNLACNVRRCPHGEEADDRRNLARKQKRARTRGGRGKRTTHWLVARTPVNGVQHGAKNTARRPSRVQHGPRIQHVDHQRSRDANMNVDLSSICRHSSFCTDRKWSMV